MPFFAFDWTGFAAVLSALTLLLPVLAKVWLDMRRLRTDYKTVWQGIITRGYIEAAKCGHMRYAEGRWIVSPDARQHYLEVVGRLKTLRRQLAVSMGCEPSDAELSWAMEQDSELQDWMLKHACPLLGVNQHGCLAIACVLARENGNDRTTDMAYPPGAGPPSHL